MIGALLHCQQSLLQTPHASSTSPDRRASEPLGLHAIISHCGTFPDWHIVAVRGIF